MRYKFKKTQVYNTDKLKERKAMEPEKKHNANKELMKKKKVDGSILEPFD